MELKVCFSFKFICIAPLKHKMRKFKIEVTLVSWGSLWHFSFAANKSHNWSSCLLLLKRIPYWTCWMVYLWLPKVAGVVQATPPGVNAHFGEVRCSIFRLDVLDNRQHWRSLKAFRSSACVDEFPCCLLVQGEDALAHMLMLFLNDVLQKHGKQEWRLGNCSTLAWNPLFMGEKSLTSRCRCSSRAEIRSYPRRCVSCRRLCAKWSYVCSQHVCKVAPPLWEATSEPLIHFSTVRRGEKWISQQIQVVGWGVLLVQVSPGCTSLWLRGHAAQHSSWPLVHNLESACRISFPGMCFIWSVYLFWETSATPVLRCSVGFLFQLFLLLSPLTN